MVQEELGPKGRGNAEAQAVPVKKFDGRAKSVPLQPIFVDPVSRHFFEDAGVGRERFVSELLSEKVFGSDLHVLVGCVWIGGVIAVRVGHGLADGRTAKGITCRTVEFLDGGNNHFGHFDAVSVEPDMAHVTFNHPRLISVFGGNLGIIDAETVAAAAAAAAAATALVLFLHPNWIYREGKKELREGRIELKS